MEIKINSEVRINGRDLLFNLDRGHLFLSSATRVEIIAVSVFPFNIGKLAFIYVQYICRFGCVCTGGSSTNW